LGKKKLTHLRVNVAVNFAQMLKIFAQILANFPAFGMQPHHLHPHVIGLCLPLKVFLSLWKGEVMWRGDSPYIMLNS